MYRCTCGPVRLTNSRCSDRARVGEAQTSLEYLLVCLAVRTRLAKRTSRTVSALQLYAAQCGACVVNPLSSLHDSKQLPFHRTCFCPGLIPRRGARMYVYDFICSPNVPVCSVVPFVGI